jgi:uroporphyrin-III C-methyltransferase / precorrin-2 dehydrogenase / sirohydrochlorin ferrochelatase
VHSLPIFVRLRGRAVILVGEGEAAEAKRRLLERAGAEVCGEEGDARLAIVVDDEAAVARLKARGVLVNAVDRPDLCDFTLPAIVDRDPVIVAVGTGGASAGLAAALRQRLEAILPAGLGALAEALFAGRAAIRREFPDPTERRRAIAAALAPGGDLDPLGPDPDVAFWLQAEELRTAPTMELASITLTSPDPDDLTLRQARLLANADRVTHGADVPRAILDRARADAARIETAAPPVDAPAGLNVDVRMA